MDGSSVGPLEKLIKEMEKMFGRGSVMRLGRDEVVPVEVFPSGSLTLDRALGVGGYPRGRVVEVFGPESSGKTTLCLHAIAEVQRLGGVAAFVDAEHALDMEYARKLGVNVENLLLSQPGNGEEALAITEALVKSGEVRLVVVDSVAALVPKAEIEGDMGDLQPGLQARLMSKAMRKLTAVTHNANATVMFTNQIRIYILVISATPETTTGGNALKFYASVRLDVRRASTIKNGDTPVGARTKVKVVKNKLAAPFRVAEFDVVFGRGVDRAAEVLDLAETTGAVERSGAWFSRGERRLGQGREAVLELIRGDASLRAELEEEVRATCAPVELAEEAA